MGRPFPFPLPFAAMKLTRTTRFAITPFMLTPVVSLVFLLLLFFVLNSTVVTQSGINVELSHSRYTLGLQPNPLIISITAPPRERIYFGDRPVTMNSLQAELANQPDKERNIILKADKRVDQATVLSVAQTALEAGFSVGIATDPIPAKAANSTASAAAPTQAARP